METYNPYMNLPGVTAEELIILEQTTAGLNDIQKKYFLDIYTSKRKSAETIRIFCIVGIVIPGIQRVMVEQIAWGILFFFTGGLFFVMTIVDIINYKTLANEFNQKMAYESFHIAKMANQFAT